MALMNDSLLPPPIKALYEVHEWRNGLAILHAARPDEWRDIQAALLRFTLLRSEILEPGGSKSRIASRLDTALAAFGWEERAFSTQIIVDGRVQESPTHSVDCFKNRVALEIEWNNKDPFFDRDLNNFRLLFELRVIDVGVIVTRCDDLQDIFKELGKGSSYGASTTHMSKLLPRIEGGGGGGCPIVVFGISKGLYRDE